jgi:hypothetical protein
VVVGAENEKPPKAGPGFAAAGEGAGGGAAEDGASDELELAAGPPNEKLPNAEGLVAAVDEFVADPPVPKLNDGAGAAEVEVDAAPKPAKGFEGAALAFEVCGWGSSLKRGGWLDSKSKNVSH